MVTPSNENFFQELPDLSNLEIMSSKLPLVTTLSENIHELTLGDNDLLHIPQNFLNVSKVFKLEISQNRFMVFLI